MSWLVYLPCGRDQAALIRSDQAAGPWVGFTASDGLKSFVGEISPEELDYVALNHAGLVRLVDPQASDALRLVLAAEIPDEEVLDVDAAEPGAVTVGRLRWRDVLALYADGADAAPAVAAARQAARGRPVLEAGALPEVASLLDGHDLDWYAPEELDWLP